MREIKDTKPAKGSTEYCRPGGRSAEDKVSPLRGKKQRWAVGTQSPMLFHKRRQAMIFLHGCPIEMRRLLGLPRRVHV